MSKLYNYLAEQILLEDDNNIKDVVVVYSGRFQPFHIGHYKTYQNLVKKFGKNNVYIGTSNVVDLPKSPFNFKEKVEIMTTMFNIPKSKIVQVKQPYKPVEILKNFDEDTTAFVTVVGEKDANRLGGKYFRKLGNDTPSEPYRDAGYVYVSPKSSNVSGTAVRNGLSTGTEEEKKRFFTNVAYPKFNSKIFNLLTNKINEGFKIDKETIEDWVINTFSKGNNGIFENTSIHSGQADDGPAGFFPNIEVFNKISVKRAKQIGYDVVNMVLSKDLEDYYEHPTYPTGPVQAVSFYPAGVIGATTPNNQIDIYSDGAYSQWYKHVTRNASLVGYQVVTTQIERDIQKKMKKQSGDSAKSDKEAQKEFNKSINENIVLPVEVGDTLLMGKFKNKKVVVKTIGKDEHGMPTINGKKVVTFRYDQKRPNIFDQVVELQEDIKVDFKNLGIGRTDMPQILSTDVDDFIKYLKISGIPSRKGKLPIKKLNLTQRDINKDKIAKLMSTDKSHLAKPIIVSKDGYILDGHHRALALYNIDNNAKINTIMVDIRMKELLKLAKSYPKVSYKNINEMAKHELDQVEKFADKSLDPTDVAFTKHFFDRVNDARNGKEISVAELVSFFKRLSKNRKKFKEFLSNYNEILVKDKKTHINIPFVKKANSIIAKTVMRKKDFKSNTPALYFERSEDDTNVIKKVPAKDKLPLPKSVPVDTDKSLTLHDVANKHNKDIDEIQKEFQKGFKIEMEQHANKAIAEKRVLDRLFQDFNYYSNADTVSDRISENKENPKITFLIGAPGSGKSTWVNKNRNGASVISRDNIVEKLAKQKGVSYNDTFNDKSLQDNVNKILQAHINSVIKDNKDIIVDMTNMSKKSRKSILSRLPKIYEKNAVVFDVPKSELLKRLKQREEETDKHIPSEVLDMMLDRFEKPTKDEFDNIQYEGISKGLNEGIELSNSEYKSNLKDLKKKISDDSDITIDKAKLFYHNAIKYGIDKGYISDTQRKKLYTHNAENFKPYSGKMFNDISKGIDIILENKKSDSIEKLVEDMDIMAEEILGLKKKNVISEGGAYGHMNHPFDTEINLTFGQLKDIVTKALDGELEFTREKTDGQALAVSWKNGKLVAARNKGHLKNQGENALDIKGVADKFKGRGELTKAYNFAMEDLSKAISQLSDKQRDKIFKGGSCFMNLEVIWPTSVNVIPYGQSLLVLHGTMEYDENGVAIGENTDAGRMLAGMIKQVNQDTQKNYVIQGPPVIELPKNSKLSAKKSKYLSDVSKLQREFKLSDKDGVAEYHQAWWSEWIEKNAPTKKLDDSVKEGLIKRWAFFDKSFRLNSKEIEDEKVLDWAQKIDKNDQSKISKENLMKFENIFLGVGAEVLEFTSSVLTVNPDEAVRNMRKRLDQTIKDVRKSGDAKKLEKLELELRRLNSIGGVDKIVPSEGIVFTYNGHTMKMTGSFAALNQILGLFYNG